MLVSAVSEIQPEEEYEHDQNVRRAGGAFLSQPARAQQAHVNLDWNPHKNIQNLKPFGANVISPDVRDDRTVTFRLKAPDAQTVALSGGPILLAIGKGNTPIPFEKGADGVWTLTVGPLKPNIYIYRLVVDGVTVVDPNNTMTGFSDQPGYSTVVVHGDGPAYYDAKPVPHGSVTRHVYHSNVLDGEREMYVYTPPNYDRNRGTGALSARRQRRAGLDVEHRRPRRLHRRQPDCRGQSAADDHRDAEQPGRAPRRSEAHRADVSAVRERAPAAHHPGRRQGLQHAGRSARPRHRRPLDGRPARAARRVQGARSVSSFGILSAGDPESEKSTPEFLNDPAINQKVDYCSSGLGTHENQPTNRSVVFHQILEKHRVAHDYYIGGDGGHDWGTWRAHLAYMLPKLWRRSRRREPHRQGSSALDEKEQA